MEKFRTLVYFLLFIYGTLAQYEPKWSSLDSRPIPQWYDDAKIGIFLHWGVYSVPSFGSEWFWHYWKDKDAKYVNFMKKYYASDFTYQDFAKDFRAQFYDPNEWADIFADSGAKYVVLTSKHHEGYTMWPSKYSYSWNSKDVGSGRDLLGELATAVRAKNLTFGVYHSLLEWYNPLYLEDKHNFFFTREFVTNKVMPELKSLIETYKPSVVWSDGDWEAPYTYWNSTGFLAWLYNESPVKELFIANDRWGHNIACKHGGVFTCDDRYNPGTLQARKWENAMTLDKESWGYRRNAKLSDFFTIQELLKELVVTVSCGGNILMNVGPTKDGVIAPVFQNLLHQMGQWLSINGEAIYASQPWTTQNDSLTQGVWYTSKGFDVYAISLQWPLNDTLVLGSANDLFAKGSPVVTLLGNEDKQLTVIVGDVVRTALPNLATVNSQNAYVVKISPF